MEERKNYFKKIEVWSDKITEKTETLYGEILKLIISEKIVNDFKSQIQGYFEIKLPKKSTRRPL